MYYQLKFILVAMLTYVLILLAKKTGPLDHCSMKGFIDTVNNVTLNEKYFIEICYIDIINRFINAMKYSH